MLTRRLQILLDEQRYQRLEEEARQRGVAVAVVVRKLIDQGLPSTSATRADAVDRILQADPMAVPDVPALREELAGLRGRRG